MANTKHEGKNVEAHLKVWLNQGKKVTHLMAWKMWGTNRLAEYVRRLRADGMPITMEWTTSAEGDRFGVYYIEQKKKESRIKTRQYLEQAYPKGVTRH